MDVYIKFKFIVFTILQGGCYTVTLDFIAHIVWYCNAAFTG